jgi:alpha-glucosidase
MLREPGAPPWWQKAVLYQIYPRSFQDSNADGVGDLPGITARLSSIVELGVDAIWLSPVYPSPGADFGYDISDYTDIDPLFGTLADMDALIEAAHQRGLKVLLDFVPNHTSDQHPWFVESRSSRQNPKRTWYLWHDPAPDGGPPNNWLSNFGGSAWELDRATGQYFYHAFLPQQPDLNWREQAVRHAMHDVMRFWLRRGIDGFRVDVIWHLLKDDQFRDDPVNPDYREGEPPHHRLLPLYTADLPEVHEVIRELRAVVDEFPERLLIGEIYLPIEKLVTYYGRDLRGTHLPFNFALLQAPWHARSIAKLIDQYEAALPPGGWPNWVLGNHDRPRIATRIGRAQAPIAAMLLLTLRGTPTLYYGDEIGMKQVPIGTGDIRDPFEKRVPGLGLGRDGARTPMQWDASDFAGFSTVKPWLPLADDCGSENVAQERQETGSLYNLYRELLRLRRHSSALAIGSYQPIVAGGDLLVYVRSEAEERLLIALNLGPDPASFDITAGSLHGQVLLSSYGDREGAIVEDSIDLRPAEGLIIRILSARL